MNLKKIKLITGLLMVVVMVTAQIPVFSISTTTTDVQNTTIHNFVPNVMQEEKVKPTNQSNFQTEQSEDEQWVLIDNLEDDSDDPISVSTKDVETYTLSDEGDIEAVYTINGVQSVGMYIEKDIMRHVYAAELEKNLKYRTANEVAESLGLNHLKSALESKSDTIIVAVIDTGIDKNHAYFNNRLVQGYDVIDDDLTVLDDNGHGTHVAGIIALSTPENVKIMPIDVFGDDGALDSSIVKGIYFAVENDAQVINLSLGGYGMTSYLQKGIQYAKANGVMVVSASGNEAHDVKHNYPAAFEEVITVGATNNSGNLLYYSNFGEAVDICAPGEKIISAYLDKGTEALSGTSMAAPFVSATAAMLWLDHEGMTLEQIEALLLANTKDLGAKGKDIAFGYGEINYENYKTDENFYLIGYSDETQELSFKYDMLLNYFAGPKVKMVEFVADGQLIYSSSSANGLYSAPINIRKLSEGAHTLKISITMNDGSKKQVFERPFTVPKYNVRIKLYDFNNLDVTQKSSIKNTTGSMIFNAQFGTYFKGEEFKFEEGTLNINIDFSNEARNNMYHHIITDSVVLDVDTPVYFRGLYTSGNYVIDPTESQTTIFELSDPFKSPFTCNLHLPITQNNYDAKSTIIWENFEYLPIIFAGLHQVTPDMVNKNQYAIYHDQANFVINITSQVIDDQTQTIRTNCLYNDYLSTLQDSPYISIRELGSFYIENDKNAIDSYFKISDFNNKVSLVFPLGKYNFEGFLPNNGYYFSGINTYNLRNGNTLNYHYSNSFDYSSNSSVELKLGKKLYDVVWSNIIGDQFICHSWKDDFDSNIHLSERKPNGSFHFVIPDLILTDAKTKDNVVLSGTQNGLFPQGYFKVTTMHMYDVSKVPNGIYEISFTLDSEYKELNIDSSFTIVEIKNGKIVSQNNTDPKSIKKASVSIMAHDKLELDLSQLFWDSEQDKFYYFTDEGVVINNTFYYQDLLSIDKEVYIMAYDGLGGIVDCKLTIKIGDDFEITNDFEPVQDIVLIGASSWAKTAISQGISEGLVNNDLLENYQSEITREELCELIITTIEAKRGKIAVLKGIDFKDTSNEAVLKAASLGIISSNSYGEINPRDRLTRQQLFTMLLTTAQKLNNQTFDVNPKNKQFSDWNQISSWAVQGTIFCVNNGIISGNNGKIEPLKSVTREEAITMIVKLWNGVKGNSLK